MNFYLYLSLFIFLVFISSLVTGLIRRFSINNKLYDIPNMRSSHDIPKPKGGGVSIVIILLATIFVLTLLRMIDPSFSLSMLIGLSIVAVTGLIDDFRNLPILIRAILYVFASVLSIYLIGGMSYLSIDNYSINLGYISFALSIIFVVWLTNLYNFMDGTDGFAAIQTICVAIFCGSLLYSTADTSYVIILFCLASSTIGFLYWNWSPAKIFMGDVGSCTIGFLFGMLSIYMQKAEIMSISIWLILLAPFIGDSTFTLLKRMINREKWYKAHNSHAYQKLYKLGWSHSKLAIGLLILNILIIWPFAYIVFAYNNTELVMLILTYSIIYMIWFLVQYKYVKSVSTIF